jgi:hypothetical protein
MMSISRAMMLSRALERGEEPMKRSAFLWIAGLGTAMLGVAKFNSGKPAALRSERSMTGIARAGRCQTSRGPSRWSGYTIDEVVA